MLTKLKEFFFGDKDTIDAVSTASIYKPVSYQEDSKTAEVRKRVNKAFDQQQKQMNLRALKRHSMKCSDPLMCSNPHCWTWEPDRIVSEPYVVTREIRKKDRSKYGIDGK